MKGKFITFEGCEGVGKSTQLSLLADRWKETGRDVLFTREPGGSRIAEGIRSVILDPTNTGMTDTCEALLYAAARAQLLEEKIGPALAAGRTVVCDRYVDSSFAYQGFGRGLGLEAVARYNDYALTHFLPDVTLFLDLPPREAFSRKHGADENDRMEQAGLAFHERVYEGYLTLCERYPDRIVRIDARGDAQEVFAAVCAVLRQKGMV